MQPKKQITSPQLEMFRNRLENILNRQHELYRLSGLIGLETFEQEFGKLYAEQGSPRTPIRLMVGLTYLGHAYQGYRSANSISFSRCHESRANWLAY